MLDWLIFNKSLFIHHLWLLIENRYTGKYRTLASVFAICDYMWNGESVWVMKVMHFSFPTASCSLNMASTVSGETTYQPRVKKTLLSFAFWTWLDQVQSKSGSLVGKKHFFLYNNFKSLFFMYQGLFFNSEVHIKSRAWDKTIWGEWRDTSVLAESGGVCGAKLRKMRSLWWASGAWGQDEEDTECGNHVLQPWQGPWTPASSSKTDETNAL